MIHVGTSNWAQQAIRATLPPERLAPGGMLQAYARHFGTVEINSTFYKFHRPQTLAGWRKLVPRGFIFAVKGNRLFTHDRTLRGPEPELGAFLGAIRQLGPPLGPVLFQLPARFTVDAFALKGFLTHLRAHAPEMRFTFELRHPSWHIPAIWRILEKANAGFCLFDIRQFTSPIVLTSELIYVRLHGPLKRPYQGRYGARALVPWAEQILKWHQTQHDCFVYFDNTQYGDAVPDADTLQLLLSNRASRPEGEAEIGTA